MREVASDQQDEGYRTNIVVDRDAAMRLGVPMQAVEDTLYDSFGQRQVSTIFGQANQYRVILEADPAWQQNPDFLNLMRVPATNGTADTQVPLSAIARIEKTVAPLVVTHQEQFPAVTLSFNLARGYSLGDAVDAVARAEHDIGMPETISGIWSGDAAEFRRSLASEPWLILAAVVVVSRDRWRALACLTAPVAAVVLTEYFLKPVVDRHYDGVISFPSGTTTAVSALAMVWVLAVPGRFRPVVAVVGAFVVGLECMAVVGLLWHYPTDAVGGAVFGAGVVLLVDGALHLVVDAERRWRSRQTPAAGRPTEA